MPCPDCMIDKSKTINGIKIEMKPKHKKETTSINEIVNDNQMKNKQTLNSFRKDDPVHVQDSVESEESVEYCNCNQLNSNDGLDTATIK